MSGFIIDEMPKSSNLKEANIWSVRCLNLIHCMRSLSEGKESLAFSRFWIHTSMCGFHGSRFGCRVFAAVLCSLC